MTFGEKLSKLRKESNYTQEQLASVLGVSRQSVSKWETGDALPEITKLKALAELFEVTTDFLLDDTKYEYTKPNSHTVKLNVFDRLELWLDGLPQKLASVLKKYGWIGGILLVVLGVARIFTAVMSVVTLVQIGSMPSHVTSFAIPSMLTAAVSLIVQFSFGVALVVGGVFIIRRYKPKRL